MTAVQIQHFWPLLREAVIRAHENYMQLTEENLFSIFDRLLAGVMQSWGMVQGDVLYAVCITELLEDATCKTKMLNLFALYGIHPIDYSMWRIGYDTLRNFMRGIDCTSLIAQTDNKQIVAVIQKLGGKVRFALRMEV